MSEERFFTDEQVDIALRTANGGKYRPIVVPSQPKKEVIRAKTRRTIIMTAIATAGIAAFVNKGIPFIANSVKLIEVNKGIHEVQAEFEESDVYNVAIEEFSDEYKELMKQKAEIEERLGFNNTDKGMSK